VSYNVHGLRGDRAVMVEVVRELAPDLLVLQQAPRRLRWRGRNARLAHALDLVYVTGGAPSLGNVIMTNLRIRPYGTWELRYPLTPGRNLRGAAFARCTAKDAAFVVVGSQLATDPVERPGQAERLKKALADLDEPVIVAVDLHEAPDGPAWRTVADGLVDAAGPDATGPATATGQRRSAILVDPRITVTGYQVVDSPAAGRASGHQPLVADLALPG
jgi:endonuclease/exonuclease/phosphatase family metal-dependent hydrolase